MNTLAHASEYCKLYPRGARGRRGSRTILVSLAGGVQIINGGNRFHVGTSGYLGRAVHQRGVVQVFWLG